MRVLRAQDYRRMPWKNGGGETIEMAAAPAGASLDDFDWRISMARVASPGPFSLFAGVDRTLCVIAGAGLSLAFADRSVTLDRASAPFRFAGDAAVTSALVDGAIDDLNVMTRRGRCDHRVRRITLTSVTTLNWDGDVGIIVAIGGSVTLDVGASRKTLAETDCVVFDADDDRRITATPQGQIDLFVIEIGDD